MSPFAERCVLVVEDDDDTASEILDIVSRRHGWAVYRARTVGEAWTLMQARAVAMVILDRMLSDSEDGLELLRRCRAASAGIPVMVLSSLGTTRQLVTGFDAGADDYLVKPFHPDELAARLGALARRVGDLGRFGGVLRIGELEIRRAVRHASWRGDELDLGDQGFSILLVLCENLGATVSRDHLWREVWPLMVRLTPQAHVIEQAVSRVRKAFRAVGMPDAIRSHRGHGYRLDV